MKQTKAAQRVSKRIANYKANPVRKAKTASAVRPKRVAAKRKAKAKAKAKAATKAAPAKRKARAAAPKRAAVLRKPARTPKRAKTKRATAKRSTVAAKGKRVRKLGAAQLRRSAEAQAKAALIAEYGTDDPNKVAEIIKQRQTAAGAAQSKKGADMAAAKKRRKKAKRKSTAKKTSAPRKRKRKAKAAAAAAPKRKRKARKTRRTAAAAPRKAAKRRKTRRKSSRRPKTRRSTSGPTINIKLPGNPRVSGVAVQTKKRAKKRRKGGTRRRSNPVDMTTYNPNPYGEVAYAGLFENPSGPFSTASLGSFAIASGGLAIGLAGARLIDRLIATRTPAAIEGNPATPRNPWYGRNAALATLRRPDALRVGAQLGLAVAGIGTAYLTRNMTILPWLAGGMALGAFTNVLLMGIEYYLMPAIFKVEADKATEASFGNRVYPFEQGYVQDGVDAAFEKWTAHPQLAANQNETPIITSPLVPSTETFQLSNPVVALGNAQREIARLQQRLAQVAQQGASLAGGNRNPFDGAAASNAGGRVGSGGCSGGCGGGCGGGCSDTPAGCIDCNDQNGVPRLCRYTVQQGDDLSSLISTTGYSVSDINEMNDGQSPEAYWYPGNRVVLPRTICLALANQPAPAQNTTSLFPAPQEFTQDSPSLETVPGLPGTTLYDLNGYSPDTTLFDRAQSRSFDEDDDD